jgi:hypothetical protein
MMIIATICCLAALLLPTQTFTSPKALQTLAAEFFKLNRLEAHIAAQMEVDAVARYLRNDISNIHTVMRADDGAMQKILFDGRNHTLTYVTTANGERETGGASVVQLDLDQTGTFKATRQLLGREPSTTSQDVILLRKVGRSAFSMRSAATRHSLNPYGMSRTPCLQPLKSKSPS